MSRKMIDYKAEDGKIKSIDGYKVGGDFSVKVEKIESGFSGSASTSMNPYWDTTPGSNQPIRPNTHYDLGYSTIICYQRKYKTKKLEPNQFIVPVGGYHTVGMGKITMQYGEVVLQLTNVDQKYDVLNDEEGSIDTIYYLTYTVTTPGTTGDTVQLPQFFASAYLSYEIVTLGIAEA